MRESSSYFRRIQVEVKYWNLTKLTGFQLGQNRSLHDFFKVSSWCHFFGSLALLLRSLFNDLVVHFGAIPNPIADLVRKDGSESDPSFEIQVLWQSGKRTKQKSNGTTLWYCWWMEEIRGDHQLRLVGLSTIIYDGFYYIHPRWFSYPGFLNHQQYDGFFDRRDQEGWEDVGWFHGISVRGVMSAVGSGPTPSRMPVVVAWMKV